MVRENDRNDMQSCEHANAGAGRQTKPTAEGQRRHWPKPSRGRTKRGRRHPDEKAGPEGGLPQPQTRGGSRNAKAQTAGHRRARAQPGGDWRERDTDCVQNHATNTTTTQCLHNVNWIHVDEINAQHFKRADRTDQTVSKHAEPPASVVQAEHDEKPGGESTC